RYTVTVELTGFKKAVVADVVVSAEEPRGVDIKMDTGQVSESITISATTEGAHLETENADIDRAVTREEIQRLPQVGRDPYELLRLAPGVFGDGARGGNGGAVSFPNTTGPGGSNVSIFQTENQVPISANGQRVSFNNFQIDGVSVNSQTWGGSAVITPNQESVREIQVLSSSYSAEDGRNSGAQIKVVTQSGTNSLHGSAFFKYNDPDLNAFNKFGGPNGERPVRVNQMFRQFGGSIGGPILKDKLFYFFSYEGLRNNSTDFFSSFVETPQYRQLVISTRPGSVTSKIFQTPGMEPRILTVLPKDCAAVGSTPCQVVNGGLDLGSPTGAVGQYVPKSIGGGFDGIPDIMFAQFALPARISGDQYNFRFDFSPNSNNQFAVSTYITHFSGLNSDASWQSRPIGDIRSKRNNPSIT